jgi:hypothetical protein
MKRSKLKLKLNRETLATLDGAHLRVAGGDCTCTACTNCTCCPTCASCNCPPPSDTCWTDTCTQNNESNCICA